MSKYSLVPVFSVIRALALVVCFDLVSCDFTCPGNYTYPPFRAFPHPSPNKFYYCFNANETGTVYTCSPPTQMYNAKVGHCEDVVNPSHGPSSVVPSPTPVVSSASSSWSSAFLTSSVIATPTSSRHVVSSTPWPTPSTPYTTPTPTTETGVLTSTAGGPSSPTLPPRRECVSLTFNDMVNCFKNKTEESKERLKAKGSTSYRRDILNKTVEGADEIFTTLLKKNTSHDFNGFDIVSSVDAIGQEMISRTPSSNQTRALKLFSNTMVVELSLFNQGYIFPDTSRKEYKSSRFAPISISFSAEFQPTTVNGTQRRVFCVLYFGLQDHAPVRVLKSTRNYSVNSQIISCQLTPSAQTPSRGNVYITSKHIQPLDREGYSVCAFWDFAASLAKAKTMGDSNLAPWEFAADPRVMLVLLSAKIGRLSVATIFTLPDPTVLIAGGHGAWSRRGCHVMSGRSNSTHTVCSCNHLTNFAILMGKDRYQASEAHTFALNMITYAGSALSLFGAVAAVCSFIILTGLHSDRTIIHTNLLTSIAISQTVFLAGVEQTASKAQCKFTAIMLHYFYLVSFAWMLCEGFHLYAMIVKVFNLTSRIYHFVAFAWGTPAVLVIITAAVQFDSYGTNSSCWLSSKGNSLLAFIIPVAFTVVVNCIIMALVLKEVLKLQTSGRPHMLRIVKTALKSLAILFPLLGITWVFGLLLFATKQIVFQYLFAIFSSMQGFFIFLLHCVFNSEIRKSYRRKKETWKSLRAIRSMKKRLSCSVTPSSAAVTPGTKEQTISSERAVTFHRT